MNSEFGKVQAALEHSLVATHHVMEWLPADRQPLFLLVDAKPNLVGFASLDGQPERDYEHALAAFKSLYADFANQWPEHDLSLVLCTHDSDASRSENFNRIELDRHFCRKFVIDLNQPLDEQMERLPFVPLNPERMVGLARPLSAQTLLVKRHDVAGPLAESLTVPGKGPETIVSQCLEGKMGSPSLKSIPLDTFVAAPSKRQPRVRLREMQIQNFRAYRSQTLPLDADLIVLYGPNGLGKTSFFDALDFVCTGGVSRFDERFGKEKEGPLMSALTHLGTSPLQAFVNATMSVQGKAFRVERRVAEAKTAMIDGAQKNRKKTLARLLGLADVTKMDLRIENLVRLFRATHLFGQDSASLTSEVHNSSLLPDDTVSRMLAFQDYVEALNKSKKIIAELNSKGRTQDSQRANFAAAMIEKESERNRLRQTAARTDPPESVLIKGQELARRIVRTGQIEIEVASEINSSIVQGWRALVEGELHGINNHLEKLAPAQRSLTERETASKTVLQQDQVLESQTKQLSNLRRAQSENLERLDKLQEQREQALREKEILLARRDSIRWLLDNRTRHRTLEMDLAKNDDEIKNAKLELTEAQNALDMATSQRKVIEDRIGEWQGDIQSSEGLLSRLTTFLVAVDDWRKALDHQAELNRRIELKEQELSSAKGDLEVSQSDLQAALTAERSANELVTELQRVQSELQTILDNIVRHATSEICPVCGTSHESREELLGNISRQRGVQPEALISGLTALESARTRVATCQGTVEGREQLVLTLARELAVLKRELVENNTRLNEFVEAATSLPIASEVSPDSYEIAASSKASELSASLRERRGALAAQLSETERQANQVNIQSERRRTASARLSELESQREPMADSVSAMVSEARNRGIDFDQGLESAQRELSLVADQLEKTKVQESESDQELQILSASVGKGEHDIEHLTDLMRHTHAELARSRDKLREIEDLLASAGLDPGAAEQDVAAVLARLVEKQANLSRLRDQIVDFEFALDAAQTHAALVRLQDEISRLQKSKQSAEKELGRIRAWQDYFEEIHNALREVQDELLSDYIDKYGPLASKIQQRLRRVYGFSGMKLKAQKGGIAVTVERAGAQYSPSDYFSESQLQIVTLSLFLSAVLSQTWSSFGLVLLDDPVTHFDDLNVYAFLDLIRGLLDEPGEGHQFILSTCEERFYRLMRQRFSKGKGSAAFYEFESIGENGPVIRQG